MSTIAQKMKIIRPINSVPLGRTLKIAFINPPFASRHYPSLGLSILKALLLAQGHSVAIHYANLFYADLVGADAYDLLSEGACIVKGEHVFSPIVCEELISDVSFIRYVENILPFDEFEHLVENAVEYIDCIAGTVLAGDPDIVGLTSTFLQRKAALAIAKRIKAIRPNIHIIFGGADCESPMGEALLANYSFINAVFHGDAENSLLEYIFRFSRNLDAEKNPIPGVTWRGDAEFVSSPTPVQTNLNELPISNYSDYIAAAALYRSVPQDWQLTYESSRGCWWGQKHHCTFCGLNGGQMTYRQKSTSMVQSELRALSEAYGNRDVVFTDNIVPSNAPKSLLRSLEEAPHKSYFFETKANLKRSDFLQMRRSRVRGIQPGIERLNSQVLKVMRKGVSAYQNVQLLRWADEFEIKVYWNYLHGFAGENPSDLKVELELLPKLFHLPPPGGAFQIRVDRFSPLFDHPEEHGISVKGPIGRDRWTGLPPLPESQVAYFFDFEFLNECDVANSTAWKEISSLVTQWINVYRPDTFTYCDLNGIVTIRDIRDKTEAKVITLSGALANCFRSVEGSPSHNVIDEYCLSTLIENELVASIDNSLIVLPVRRCSHSDE